MHGNLSYGLKMKSSECEQQFLDLCVKTDSERATLNHTVFHFPFLIPLCNL